MWEMRLSGRVQITYWLAGHCVDVGFNLRQWEVWRSLEIFKKAVLVEWCRPSLRELKGNKRSLKKKRETHLWMSLTAKREQRNREGSYREKSEVRKKLLLP